MKIEMYKTVGTITSVIILAATHVASPAPWNVLDVESPEYASCHLTASLVRVSQYLELENCSEAIRTACKTIVGEDNIGAYKSLLWNSLMDCSCELDHAQREAILKTLSTQEKLTLFKGVLLSLFDINNEYDSLKSMSSVIRYFADLYDKEGEFKADFNRLAVKFSQMASKRYRTLIAFGLAAKTNLEKDTQFTQAFRKAVLDEMSNVKSSGLIDEETAKKAITRRINN